MKKGILAADAVELLIKLFFVFTFAIFLYVVSYSYLKEPVNIANLESYLLSRNLLYSDSCLAYSDEVKIYPLQVDVKKLSDERLNACFSKETMGFRVTLYDKKGREVKSAKSLTVKQEGLLTRGTKLLYPVCNSVPQYKCSIRKDLVLYNAKEDNLAQGFLVTEVVNFVG